MRLSPAQFDQALAAAQRRGFLPTKLGTADLREVITPAVRERCLVLARGTNAEFLGEVVRALKDQRGNEDRSSDGYIIARLQQVLQRLGYNPETGFPGDAAKGIPSAKRGSLRDLSSYKRLKLILETERALASGKAQQIAGLRPIAVEQAPAWELVRLQDRKVPRGSPDSGTRGWLERWQAAKGPLMVEDGAQMRMIAAKTDPVWQALGDSSLFNDGLDVAHPPFVFGSGMGWRPVLAEDVRALGVDMPRASQAAMVKRAATMPPAPKAQTKAEAAKPAPPGLAEALRAAILAGRRQLGITQGGGSL